MSYILETTSQRITTTTTTTAATTTIDTAITTGIHIKLLLLPNKLKFDSLLVM